MKRTYDIIGFCITWFAVCAQFMLMLQHRQAAVAETIIRFFSFFTILTNILVALLFTTNAFRLRRFPFNLFSAKGSLTAITAFILIVGLVYQIVLRSLWEPKGLQWVVDELLHTLIPLYMLLYWWVSIRKNDLTLRPILSWLLYPIGFIVFILIRGYFSNYYPYPFLNVTEIGFEKTMVNIVVIFGVTVVILMLLLFAGKRIVKNRF